MPSLSSHQSNDFVKLLLLGDAKSGKTSSLVSLVEAGYKLRILDMDNLLDGLKHQVMSRCPDKIDNIEFRTLRDKFKMVASGPTIDGPAKAFINAIKMLDSWKYTEEGVEVDLGKPSTWGPDCILVIDSLSRLCDACFDWREPLTGHDDKRATFYDAQNAIKDVLATLTSKGFETNVIVICHGLYMDQKDGTTKIFPQSVGKAIAPEIPQYFPNYVRFKNLGGKRTIQLKSDPLIDLAASKPNLPDTLPAETGLATFFEALRSAEPAPKSTSKITPMNRRA